MSIRLSRLMTLGLGAGLMLSSFAPAHAAGPAVKITTADGSKIFSVPSPAAAAVPTTIDGTAAFDAGSEGAVRLTYTQVPAVGRPDPSNPTKAVDDVRNPKPVLVYETVIACDAGNANCATWSDTVPFVLLPGTYQVTATASQNGLETTATDKISVTVL